MRLLADENSPRTHVDALRTDGHDLVWARTRHPSASDSLLLDFAEAQSRIVLTLDKDFWQFAIQRRTPFKNAGVVLFRVHPATAANLAPLLEIFVASDEQWSGQISIIAVDRIHMMAAGRPI